MTFKKRGPLVFRYVEFVGLRVLGRDVPTSLPTTGRVPT